MKPNKCLLCGETAILRAEKFPGYKEPEIYSIYHCSTCNTSFSLPRVDTTAVYNLIYSHGNKVPGYSRYWDYKNTVKVHPDPLIFLKDIEAMYWGVITALQDRVNDRQNTKILEIGCGMGYLTYSLIRDGYNVTGLDISQEAVAEATRSYGNHFICADIFEYAGQHMGEYSVIIMSEVIEHIEAPVDFLDQAIKLLKTDGELIVTTPNKTIYPERIVWRTDLPPVHCWWLSEESMKYIAGKINCEVDFVDFTNFYLSKNHAVDVDLTVQSNPTHIFSKEGEVIVNRRLTFLEKMKYLFTFSKKIMNGKYSFLEKLVYLIESSKIYKRIRFIFSSNKLYRCEK
jgi:SAM-dependent methyltransferase